jgi:beta-lactam-binding protein with PASTA domain
MTIFVSLLRRQYFSLFKVIQSSHQVTGIHKQRMNFLRFLISRAFFIQLGIAIIVTILLALMAFKFLGLYTLHGQSITLPDFTGHTLSELEPYRNTYHFRFTVIDSVYNDKKFPGSIILQDPAPGSPVKKGRNIYLTLVAGSPEQITMPNLLSISLRQAVSLLETYGLKSGYLTFVPDPEIEHGNLIKAQLLNGDTLHGGEIIKKGSTIDLVIGKSPSYSEVPVPLVIGQTLDQAILTLNKAALNVGNTYFLDNDEQEYYKVYRQEPDFAGNVSADMGSAVNLWLRSERNFDFAPLIQRYQQPDTIKMDVLQENLIELDTID